MNIFIYSVLHSATGNSSGLLAALAVFSIGQLLSLVSGVDAVEVKCRNQELFIIV
jgi:hypothetical protein